MSTSSAVNNKRNKFVTFRKLKYINNNKIYKMLERNPWKVFLKATRAIKLSYVVFSKKKKKQNQIFSKIHENSRFLRTPLEHW